jgi:hypothetical protein
MKAEWIHKRDTSPMIKIHTYLNGYSLHVKANISLFPSQDGGSVVNNVAKSAIEVIADVDSLDNLDSVSSTFVSVEFHYRT